MIFLSVKNIYVNVYANSNMVGRPRNPNREPASKLVRLTPKQWRIMLEFHQGKEPYGDTISRAFQMAKEMQKKVEGLQLEIEDQRLEIESKGQAYSKLFSVKENLRQRVENLEKEREHFVMRKSLR